MKLTRPVFIIAGMVGALCVSLSVISVAWAGEATITGVRVAPDSSNVMVLFEGQVGKPAAAVIGHPYRLVLDFESSDLAKFASKIQGQREPIKQVRVGHANARTRVVVDFGENPVPPFRIEREDGQVMITFGNRLCLGKETFDQPAASSSKPRSDARPPRSGAASCAAKKLPIAVKTAQVQGDLVIVELSDTKNPKQTYRLVLGIDQTASKVSRVTLSETPRTGREMSEFAGNNESGPDPDADALDSGASVQPSEAAAGSRGSHKFTWGSPSKDTSVGGVKPRGRGPLRVERYTLPARSDAAWESDVNEWDTLKMRDRR